MKSKPFQMERESSKEVDVTTELLPSDDPNLLICPEMLETHAYELRLAPDDFTMERVQKIVLKVFASNFGDKLSKENIRKYAHKVARYLGQAALSFEGKITDRIMDCITENMAALLPKKYMLHLSSDQIHGMFNDVLSVFDYERSEVNTEDVISGIFAHAVESIGGNIVNKTQHVLKKMFCELIEVLPLEEFQSEETLNVILGILEKEEFIEPKCISIEGLVESVVAYAKANLLDGITAIPIKRLASSISRELLKRKSGALNSNCSIGTVSNILIKKKKDTN